MTTALPAGNDLVRLEQRRFPRLHLVGECQGQVLPFHIAVRVIDISLHGFAIRSSIEFPTGVEHTFQFMTLHTERPVVRAVVSHTRQITDGRGRPSFVVGLSFVRVSADARQVIDDIVADIYCVFVPAPTLFTPVPEPVSLRTSATGVTPDD